MGLLGLVEGQHLVDAGDGEIGVPADHGRPALGRSAKGHPDELEVVLDGKGGHGQVPGAAGAGDGAGHLAGVFLGVLHKSLEIRKPFVVGADRAGRIRPVDHAHRIQTLVEPELGLALEHVGMVGVGQQTHGVAVGLGLGQQFVHQNPAAAGLVDHDDGFGEILLGDVRQQPGGDIGGTASAVGNHQVNGLFRISGQGRGPQSQDNKK